VAAWLAGSVCVRRRVVNLWVTNRVYGRSVAPRLLCPLCRSTRGLWERERPMLSSWAVWPVLYLSSVFSLVCWWLIDYRPEGLYIYIGLGPSSAWALGRRTRCPPRRLALLFGCLPHGTSDESNFENMTEVIGTRQDRRNAKSTLNGLSLLIALR
jgi:hypothetical protein